LNHFIPELFAFVVLGLVSSVIKWRDWLGRTSPKWLILCGVERKTSTQSISWSTVFRPTQTPTVIV